MCTVNGPCSAIDIKQVLIYAERLYDLDENMHQTSNNLNYNHSTSCITQ